MRFVAEVSDRSGGLSHLTAVLKDAGASVKDVFHERAWLHSAVDRVQIKVIIETTGADHAKTVRAALARTPRALLRLFFWLLLFPREKSHRGNPVGFYARRTPFSERARAQCDGGVTVLVWQRDTQEGVLTDGQKGPAQPAPFE